MPSVRICRGPVTVELTDEISDLDDLIFKATVVTAHLEIPGAGGRSKPAPTDKAWLTPTDN
jgi:hypothetical protein